MKRKRKNPEAEAQKAFIRELKIKYPDLIFNVDLSGLNIKTQSRWVHRLRSNRSFPDFVLYHPSGGYNGLFIEIKAANERIIKRRSQEWKNEHIEDQSKMIMRLFARGYWASFGIGSRHCIDLAELYINENIHELYDRSIITYQSAEYFYANHTTTHPQLKFRYNYTQ